MNDNLVQTPSTARRVRTATRLLIGALALATISTVAGTAAADAAPGKATPRPVTPSGVQCADVEILFARGTGVPLVLQGVGLGLVRAVTDALPDRSVSYYNDPYAAAVDHLSSGPGATELSTYFSARALACPFARFVLAGYSQGATVIDIALGIRAGLTVGTSIPPELDNRISAVVVFGNSLGHKTSSTIANTLPDFAQKAMDYCNSVDPVCAAQQVKTGVGDHTSYVLNGSTSAAGAFAVQKILQG